MNSLLKRLLPRRGPASLVLLYHRVASPVTDPQLLAVSPENFAAQLRILSELAAPVSLREAIAANERRDDRRTRVCVTFDDGYADNALTALPILERESVPASIFVTSGAIGRAEEFWWDEVERVLLHPGRLPTSFTLDIAGARRSFGLGDAADYSGEVFARHRDWHVLRGDTPTPRHAAYLAVCSAVVRLTPAERETALAELRTLPGANWTPRADCRAMTADELRKTAASPLIEIGAHTARHPVLAALGEREQRNEIAASKAALEAVLEKPVQGFAYPFGTRGDFTAATAAAVKDSGFDYACANFPGALRPSTDRYELPRLLVRNWQPELFRTKLEHWLKGDFR